MVGTGIGITLGVKDTLFSSSMTVVVTFEGVVKGIAEGVFSTVSLLCGMFRSSEKFVMLFFDDVVEDIGEKGFRFIGDSISRAPKELFLMGIPATSKPFLPA